jgi:hypothetical protein
MGCPNFFFLVPKLYSEKFFRLAQAFQPVRNAWRARTPALLSFLVPKFNLGTGKMAYLHTAPWLPELTMRL